ncbi:MAG: GNAT family N-acetyltransferase [Firmicutes bacterium]|nr:GNAT family N-acetyltransferase [Bacillota bacterium]
MIFTETDEYERLVRFFVENGLEFDGDEEVDTDIVKCYKVTSDNDELLAACVLAKREGRFIIDGIAVSEDLRRSGTGRMMLEQLEKDVLSLGGDSIYLVARAPGFFRKNGFEAIDPENAPNFFECKYCPQYGTSCHPEVMKITLGPCAGGSK